MKNFALTCSFVWMALICVAQPEMMSDPNMMADKKVESGEIVFIRDTGVFGCAVSLNAFINEDRVAKLNNKKYSVHEVSAGTNEFAGQFYGKNLKKKTQTFSFNVEPGEKKYVLIYLEAGWLVNKLHTVEISEKSAMHLMEKCKEDLKI